MIIMKKLQRTLALTAATALIAAGCATTTQDKPSPDAIDVAVSYYSLEYLASEIGGEHIHLTNVVPAGADSHDVELTIQDASLIGTADVSFILGGFQPAVDAAAAESDSDIDLASAVDIQSRDGVRDPHFWLDPKRMMLAADAIADAFAEADPDNAEDYAENASNVKLSLAKLDEDYSTALASCTHDSFVTGHSAFAYLADLYGLTEIAIAGVDPETEPSPAALAATRNQIENLGLPVVFGEPGEMKIAEVLAGELGIAARELDPIETVADGEDYFSVMYANLEALKEGLACQS